MRTAIVAVSLIFLLFCDLYAWELEIAVRGAGERIEVNRENKTFSEFERFIAELVKHFGIGVAEDSKVLFAESIELRQVTKVATLLSRHGLGKIQMFVELKSGPTISLVPLRLDLESKPSANAEPIGKR
jgi:hypothetical protein